MSAITSQVTGVSIIYSTTCSGTYQSSASLAFVRGIHRWPVNSPHKRPVTRKIFPFDDVIMTTHEIPKYTTTLRGVINLLQGTFLSMVNVDECIFQITTTSTKGQWVNKYTLYVSMIILWMKIFEYWFKCHWGLLVRAKLTGIIIGSSTVLSLDKGNTLVDTTMLEPKVVTLNNEHNPRCLTHRDWDNMVDVLQASLPNASHWMMIVVLWFKFHLTMS